MRLTVEARGPLHGVVRVPGDKSISHRALLLGAIADGPTHVAGFLPAADCLATLACVRQLGVEVDCIGNTELLVHGRGLRGLRQAAGPLDCGGSATTMRLLAGILAGQPYLSMLTGNEQLKRRPMERVADPLRKMGASVWCGECGGRAMPLTIRGGDLRGIDYQLPVASAQLKSAILLAGLYAEGPTTVREPSATRDHTERMLAAYGASLEAEERRVTLQPAGGLRSMDICVPGDLSSAAFLIVAACLVPDSEITIQAVNVNPTRTGLLDVLMAMGADLRLDNLENIAGPAYRERLDATDCGLEGRKDSQPAFAGGEPVADVIGRAPAGGHHPYLQGSELRGALVPRMIDEFPILAVAATQAEGRTVVRDASELRVKETDRINSIVGELVKMGADIEEQPDGFVVSGPTRLQGARVDCHADHRLAMSLAIAGLLAEGTTTIEGADCIGDSFPGFEQVLSTLTGCQDRPLHIAS